MNADTHWLAHMHTHTHSHAHTHSLSYTHIHLHTHTHEGGIDSKGGAVGKMVIGSGEEREVVVRGVEDFERDFVQCTNLSQSPLHPGQQPHEE